MQPSSGVSFCRELLGLTTARSHIGMFVAHTIVLVLSRPYTCCHIHIINTLNSIVHALSVILSFDFDEKFPNDVLIIKIRIHFMFREISFYFVYKKMLTNIRISYKIIISRVRVCLTYDNLKKIYASLHVCKYRVEIFGNQSIDYS